MVKIPYAWGTARIDDMVVCRPARDAKLYWLMLRGPPDLYRSSVVTTCLGMDRGWNGLESLSACGAHLAPYVDSAAYYEQPATSSIPKLIEQRSHNWLAFSLCARFVLRIKIFWLFTREHITKVSWDTRLAWNASGRLAA